MTAADEIQLLRAKLQNTRNEIGRLVRIIADRNLERREMRAALAEVRDLLLSGQIREALAVIDNEQAIYMAKREPRKVRAV